MGDKRDGDEGEDDETYSAPPDETFADGLTTGILIGFMVGFVTACGYILYT